MNISEKLKLARENAGITQRVVCSRCELDDSTLSAFETGRSEPKLGQLSKLAEVYRIPLSYFFSESTPAAQVVLWRNEPEDKLGIQAEFLELCRQYRQLESWTNDHSYQPLDNFDSSDGDFWYPQARKLATNIRNAMQLGDRPGQSLYRILEEVYAVKIFHLDLGHSGSAASAFSDEFGSAILLNSKSSRWRRNHDLAHELFHLLTWKRFNHTEAVCLPTENEEKLATCFAGNLLLPEEAVRNAISNHCDQEGNVSFEQLDTIAREFDVSLESLIWRMHFLYRWKEEHTKQTCAEGKNFTKTAPRENGPTPKVFPERYRALAIKTLHDGEISLGRFAKFMGISRSEAAKYIVKGGAEYAKIATVAI